MKPIAFSIFGQNGQSRMRFLNSGWNSIPDLHVGVWVYDTALVIWNALPGAGELFLSSITIEFDVEVHGVLARSHWTASVNTLTLGSGSEYMTPRGSLRVRWDYPARCPQSVAYGPVKLQFAPTQKRDIFHALAATLPNVRDTGMWAPLGDRQPDTPGGQGIAAVAGWEQDGAGFLLRHDLTMERMPIGCLDPNTGQPLAMPGSEYVTVRGWGKTTQLAAFTNPAHPMYDDARSPLLTWAGTCSYRDLMLGKADRSQSYLPYDAQHLCRALAPAKAAARCGDPVAQFDLAMIATDCASARTDASALPNGSRGLAWTLDAFAQYRPMWKKAKALIDRMVTAQMVNGGILRAPFGYSFAPSPWEVSETIPVPIPKDCDVDAVGLERALSVHALALDNRQPAMKKAMDGQPWPAVKFVAVGKMQDPAQTFTHYQTPVGHGGFEVWIELGALAALGVAGWEACALSNSTPGGRTCHTLIELRDTLRAETTGREETAGMVCVLEAMSL